MFHICFDGSFQIKWYVERMILICWFDMSLRRVSFHGSLINMDQSLWSKDLIWNGPIQMAKNLSPLQKWSTNLYLSKSSSFSQNLKWTYYHELKRSSICMHICMWNSITVHSHRSHHIHFGVLAPWATSWNSLLGIHQNSP